MNSYNRGMIDYRIGLPRRPHGTHVITGTKPNPNPNTDPDPNINPTYPTNPTKP